MNFISRSQAGQDLAVHALLGGKRDGWFIDIGCSHPVDLSNTYALEQQLGWRGILLDSSINAIEMCRAQRSNHAWCDDATKIDWAARLLQIEPPVPAVIDYASVDVDEHTHAALENLLRSGKRFRVLTVEHDHYARGDRLRLPNRDLLRQYGYDIIASDVHSNKCSFEDWAVAPDMVDMKVAERFRSNGLDWADVLKQGGAL